jgi:hypothetical protein
LIQIGLGKHDDGLWMIADKATHLDVSVLTDDDGLITFTNEHSESLVGLVNERTGRVGDLVAVLTPPFAVRIRGTVRGDDDVMRGRTAEVVEIAFASADGAEVAVHELVVHELAEDGDRLAFGGIVRGAEGVAHAEAHTVMFGEDDVHGVY